MDRFDLIIDDLARNAIDPKTRAMYQFLKEHRAAKLASKGVSNPSQQDAGLLIPCHSNWPDVEAEELGKDED